MVIFMDIILTLKEELQVEKWQVEAAVKLIDEGNTIPFISRYRKEATGSLNDEQLRDLFERLTYLRNLEEKKEQVLKSIEEQGKLTEELKEKILAAQTLVVVEDLYRPYRPKRKTRASIAKEKGLEGLAEYIMAQNAAYPVEEEAAKYVTGDEVEEALQVKTVAEALQGAMDIIAESISDEADYRLYIRNITMEEGEKPEITRAKMIPIVTQYDTTNRREVRIYPFSEYTDELVAAHGMKEWHEVFSIDYMQGIIDKNIPEEFLN